MTLLRYVGPYPAVDVPTRPGAATTVANGDTAEFDDDLAQGLLEQPDNWQLADPKKPTAKKTAGDTADA